MRNLVVLTICLFIIPMLHGADHPAGTDIVKEIYKKTGDAVVYIESVQYMKTRTRQFSDPYFEKFFGEMFGQDFDFFFESPRNNNVIPRKGQGTGFIFDKKGYILTNEHVVSSADEITVTLAEGTKHKAKLIGADSTYDLAVLKIDAGENLPCLEMGDSESLEVGEWVLAIGNPFGLDRTLTVGIISALGRNLPISRNKIYSNLIQTDASINPGNSGGPLIDLKGRVIGINTAIIPGGQGLGFAIPIKLAARTFEDIMRYGQVRYPFLGVYLQDLDEKLLLHFGVDSGVLVADTVKDQPAAKAGIESGDVITAFNGKKVKDSSSLQSFVRNSRAGDKAYISIVRSGKEYTRTVVLARQDSQGEAPTNKPDQPGGKKTRPPGKAAGVLSITVRDLARDESAEQSLEHGGVFVVQVQRGGLCDGILKPGDIILQLEGRKIGSLDEFETAFSELEDKEYIVLVIRSDRLTRFVTVTIKS